MGLFSKELQELDRNTVQYMIDVMQEEIDTSKRLITEQEIQLKLYEFLNQDGRLEDLAKAISDADFRHQLLIDYNLL